MAFVGECLGHREAACHTRQPAVQTNCQVTFTLQAPAKACRFGVAPVPHPLLLLPAGDADHPGLSIAWGTCGHVFHLDCIQRWLKTRSACPLCNREWEFSKIERIVGGSANAE